MELSSFSEYLVTVPFGRGANTIDITVNIDAFTPEFFREVGSQFQAKLAALATEDKKKAKGKKAGEVEFFEQEARALEIQREIHASLLSNGVLKGWTVTEKGAPVEPTKEVLMGRPPLLVEALWEACLKAAKTVKKRAEEEDTDTLDNTANGSEVHLKLAPTG